MKLPLISLAALAATQGAHVPTARVAADATRLVSRHGPRCTVLRATCYEPGPPVTSVSVLPNAGQADVVIGIESSVEVQDFTLESPHRVIIDLKGASLSSSPTYDHVTRGGITNVRVSQYRPNTVRVVIEMDASHPYEVKRSHGEVRVTVSGGVDDFAAWRSGSTRHDVADADDNNNDNNATDNNDADNDTDAQLASAHRTPMAQGTQRSTQPRITVTYQDADIHDVISAFASFAGRTIIAGRDVTGTITAEIRNQPWDVALRSLLQAQGLAASEDPSSGIITVDSYANIQAKQALEPLTTRLVPINYAKADSLVPVITKLLARDCSNGSSAAGGTSGGASESNCITRGAVAANASTNTIIVTETPSRINDILNYVHNLDVRTPQVAIKAKIIFVNRTDIENLGLSYDLGSRNQFFTQLVKRTDPSTLKPVDTNGDGINDALGGGTPYQADQILLGGNTLSGIANANNRITAPALSLIYSAALGRFSLTSFLDALQEVRLADLQAEPSIVTVDNREAQIQVGQDIPVRVLDANTAASGGTGGNQVPRATVSFKPVGIILKVTPHITNDGQILLDVHAENSDAQIASSDVGYVFNKQSADNRLLVADGETAVIGGLTVTQVSQSKSGIPVLVDLPGIGRLFGVTTKQEEKRDLLILITPHVIDQGERVNAQR